MMALGACRERGAKPLLPSLPLPSLPGCSLPVALARSQGCWVLAWGPSPAQPAPSPHPWEAREPVLPLRCGPWPAGSRPERAPLPAWMRPLLLEREGQLCQRGQSLPGWMAAPAPLLGASSPSQGAPRSFFLLVSGIPELFSAEQVGCRRAVPASHAPVQPSLPHTLPLPREPTSFLPSAPLPGSKLPPLPVLQTLFSSEIRSSPAALYESHRRQKEAE